MHFNLEKKADETRHQVIAFAYANPFRQTIYDKLMKSCVSGESPTHTQAGRMIHIVFMDKMAKMSIVTNVIMVQIKTRNSSRILLCVCVSVCVP